MQLRELALCPLQCSRTGSCRTKASPLLSGQRDAAAAALLSASLSPGLSQAPVMAWPAHQCGADGEAQPVSSLPSTSSCQPRTPFPPSGSLDCGPWHLCGSQDTSQPCPGSGRAPWVCDQGHQSSQALKVTAHLWRRGVSSLRNGQPGTLSSVSTAEDVCTEHGAGSRSAG